MSPPSFVIITLQDCNSVETAGCCEANRFRASPAVSSPSLPASRSGATVRLCLHLLVYTQPSVPFIVQSPTSYSAVDAVTTTPLKDSLASILLKHSFLPSPVSSLFPFLDSPSPCPSPSQQTGEEKQPSRSIHADLSLVRLRPRCCDHYR